MTREELNEEKQNIIFDEEKNKRRKIIAIRSFKIITFFIICIISFYFYNSYVSTTKVIVKEKRIVNSYIPDSFNGAKIVHFSDVHYGSNIFEPEMKNIVKMINVRNPDIVIFSGDLIDNDYKLSQKEKEKLILILKDIKATLGKYCVIGDEDGDDFSTIFNQAGFITLSNEYDLVYKNSNSPILLMGFSSKISNSLDVNKGFSYFDDSNANTDIFKIAIFHEPDSITDILQNRSVDLALAGHSHNGYIDIPYLDFFKKTIGAETYYDSYYNVDNTDLYISSGIGTKGSGIRLFCHPSINFFRLSNK